MNSLNTILQSEYYTASGYFDRLVFALTELSEFHYTPSGRDLFKKIFDTNTNHFAAQFKFEIESDEHSFKIATFKRELKNYQQYIEKYIALPFSTKEKVEMVVNYINLLYQFSHQMHDYVLQYTNFDIQYPRQSLSKEKFTNIENELFTSKEFFIDILDIEELNKEIKHNSKVNFLELKREEKYDHFISKGHAHISNKEYEKAQENFYKAKNYKDTAEVYTLLAWSYSFLNDLEKAKNYCLKAITKDPQYGPAYNDFGNYLMSEGNIEDSLKWFELAKKAVNYQNREYPYINAGRAFMMQKKYAEALKEFSYALILAPYHEELHATVKKLKQNLEKSEEYTRYKENEINHHETI